MSKMNWYTTGLGIGLCMFSVLSATKAHAGNWENVLSCEGGAAVVDVDSSERHNLQLVFRGGEMLTRMYDAGFASPRYGDHEFIIRGTHSALKQISPTATTDVYLNGVFNRNDFRSLVSGATNSGQTLIAEIQGSNLVLKRFYVQSGSSCDGYYDAEGMCRGTEIYHKTFVFQSEYVLRDCR